MMLFYAETLVSDRRHISKISLPKFNKPTLFLTDSKPRICGLATYIRYGFFAPLIKFSSLKFAVKLIISISLVLTENLI